MATKNGTLRRAIQTASGVQAFDDIPVEFPAGVTDAAPLVFSGFKVARGQLTTASASDTVVTGLATVVAVVATLEDNPIDTCSVATAQVGDQAGAPAAGSIIIKTWKPTTGGASGNPTLVAATAFTKKVNWVAIGT